MKILTALITQDTLSEALRHGKRFTVRIAGKPDGERNTFKAAQALARQRGATDYVLKSNSYELKETDTRFTLMRCTRTFFEDGGRTETRCNRHAENVCAGPECENVRCDECDDLGFDEVNGQTLCEECQPEPETAHCANCKQVQPLKAYDDKALAKTDDLKQCAVCGHIVDSERKQ